MDRVHPHYNLSNVTGYEAVVTEGTVAPDSKRLQLGYAKSLDSLSTGEFKAWLRTMIVHTDGRLMVWVDPEAYAGLYAIQLLSMNPEMTKEELLFFLTMVKVKFDTVRLSYGSSVDTGALVLNITDKLDAIYRLASKFAPIMKDMLYSDPNKWSLEWRILSLIDTGKDSLGVHDTVMRIQRRNIILSCIEALAEIQHIVGDRANWDTLGCDESTLLGSDSVFKGLLSYSAINADWMLSSNPYDQVVTNDQLIAAAEEAIAIFTIAGDQHMIDRTGYHIETIRGMLDKSYTTMDIVERLFGGRIHGCRVNDTDSSKYNETMIKYFLSMVK